MMLKQLKKIITTGIVSEPIDARSAEFEVVGKQCQKLIKKYFSRSLAIRQVDAGSCNGCELEIQALNNSIYNIERFGIHFVASPRHADLLLVTGPVSKHMEHALKTAYDAMPEPKLVIAIGQCAQNGGEFGCSYACSGAVSNIIPVDFIVSGCPPTPLNLLTAITTVISRRSA